MSDMRASIETLPNGLRTVVLNQPHWLSSSARLSVAAGNMHEEEGTPSGVAHFFEHVVFQGTEKFDTIEDFNDFREERGMHANAFTNKYETRFIADSSSESSIQDVLTVVSELGTKPRLDEKTLERERGAIIDEARGYQFSPDAHARYTRMQTIAGKKYAKSVTGTVEEAALITSQDVQEFHERHYRAANMILVVCSPNPTDETIETIETYFENTELPQDKTKHQPVFWNLPWLEVQATTIKSELPIQAQSNVSLHYTINPEMSDTPENIYKLYIAASAIGRIAHKRIRTELGIAYHASASSDALLNRSFGVKEDYRCLSLDCSTSAENISQAHSELIDSIIGATKDRVAIQRLINRYSRGSLLAQEQIPSVVADNIFGSVLLDSSGIYDSYEESRVIGNIKVDDIIDIINQFTKKEPSSTIITSPSEELLESYKS